MYYDDVLCDEEPPDISRRGRAAATALSRPNAGQSATARSGQVKLLSLGLKGAGVKSSPASRSFRERFFPEATDADWSDWRWQIRNRVSDETRLREFLTPREDEASALSQFQAALPFAVTPYYLSLIDPSDPADPLRRCVVPTAAELTRSPGEADDPLGEEHDSPAPGLVHRYPDRVLFLATDFCSTYCRYCTRSRLVGRGDQQALDGRPLTRLERWEAAIAYIQKHAEIRDVLISGGDPLTLPDQALEWLLKRLRAIRHVEILRIGTKVPAVLPQRVTTSLTRLLKRFHPLFLSVHFAHPNELTPESRQACNRLADAGVPLGSQTVFLNGVNNAVPTLTDLYHGLLQCRVRPYYLYQCDPIPGSGHFRTPVAEGLAAIQGLRGHTSGYAVPTYVIDAPGGGGKIPLLPEYCQGREGDELLLVNYQGKTYRYPDPSGVEANPASPRVLNAMGAAT